MGNAGFILLGQEEEFQFYMHMHSYIFHSSSLPTYLSICRIGIDSQIVIISYFTATTSAGFRGAGATGPRPRAPHFTHFLGAPHLHRPHTTVSGHFFLLD